MHAVKYGIKCVFVLAFTPTIILKGEKNQLPLGFSHGKKEMENFEKYEGV